ncbi:hypothetical protein Rhal01_00638 [Rubritalea halochordaticola]|uniref:PEP-CTERM sorting domain-containing protein n=2 Tax=Rubritalea halochordaticola TaxID=714537 RepID=A0ABP9UZK3_9BACT
MELMKKLTSLIASLVCASSAQAALILDFDFSGVAGDSLFDPDTFELTDVDTKDANLDLLVGLNAFEPSVLNSTTAGGAASNDWNLVNWGGSVSATVGDAVAGNRFISFTIQAASGYMLNLDGATISYTAYRNGSGAPEKFATLAVVGGGGFSAADQLDAGIDTPFGTPGSGSTGSGNTETWSDTFTGAEWDGVTESIEVRLYGWDGTGNMHFSDVKIDGAEVALVPETSISMMIGLAGLGLIIRRRRV